MDDMDCTQSLMLVTDISKFCSVKIEGFEEGTEQVLMQGPNHIVLTTMGSSITQRCPDSIITRKVTRGTYTVTWDQKCMLQTDHWAIPGLVTFQSKLLLNSSVWIPLDFEKVKLPSIINHISL